MTSKHIQPMPEGTLIGFKVNGIDVKIGDTVTVKDLKDPLLIHWDEFQVMAGQTPFYNVKDRILSIIPS
jgi:hypothetical protein